MNDKTKLLAEAVRKYGDKFDESKINLDEDWTYYHARIVPSHTTERLVVLRPKPKSKVFGCVRVLDEQNNEEMIWEVVQKEGAYIGHVPAQCSFEALLVEVKLITMKK